MPQKIIHKTNASLKFLYRKKMFINQYCGKTVCMAMIQSRIDYASNDDDDDDGDAYRNIYMNIICISILVN